MNELISVLVSTMLGAFPTTPAPSIIVSYDTLETAVEQYVEEASTYNVTVSCGNGEITIPSTVDKKIVCAVTNVDSHETFSADVKLHVTDTKVKVSATLLAEDTATPY